MNSLKKLMAATVLAGTLAALPAAAQQNPQPVTSPYNNPNGSGPFIPYNGSNPQPSTAIGAAPFSGLPRAGNYARNPNGNAPNCDPNSPNYNPNGC